MRNPLARLHVVLQHVYMLLQILIVLSAAIIVTRYRDITIAWHDEGHETNAIFKLLIHQKLFESGELECHRFSSRG